MPRPKLIFCETRGVVSLAGANHFVSRLAAVHIGDFARRRSRIRRLLVPAFRNRTVAAMRPTFQALADELIDGFAPRGQVELISEFAEPYAARIICLLLGLPDDEWRQVAHWADDLGASFSVDGHASP